MPREIKMPKLSDTMEEGTINAWRKREGDRIARGEVILDVETDKADMEYEAYVAGTLAKILVQQGQTVAVGTPIAVVKLDSDSDADVAALLAKLGGGAPAQAAAAQPAPQAPAPGAPAPAARAPERPATPAAPAPAPATPSAFAPAAAAPSAPAAAPEPAPLAPEARLAFFLPDPDRVRATPRARLLASERGVDLSEIHGSGPDAAVLVSDVEAWLKDLEEERAPAQAGDVPATPVAARMAEELGLDLSRVSGTGPGGRVTKRDLRDFLEREKGEGPARERALFGDEIRLSQKRKFLIRQMVESKKHAPHFYVSMDVDADPMRALHERQKAQGKRITYTHMIVKGAALALERHPDVNATFRDDRIVHFNPINIAVATAVQDELVAPVVRDCQGRDLDALAAATDALIAKARERKLAPDDYSDGTFTISNLGMFGVDHFYAIITPPQATVLSVGGVREIPVVDAGEIRIGRRMTFGLACDHRVLDGAGAAQFLATLKEILEDPEQLLRRSTDGA
jgi:pyruvate dehydrogenase E2 component (dihydrolipoamide acetyltransferase)